MIPGAHNPTVTIFQKQTKEEKSVRMKETEIERFT